eukprot:COSAG01_NODE_1267_length_10974_cov_9.876598_2_plen_155_part_00
MLYKTAADHPGNVHYMFLCRVVLGYTLRTRRQSTYCKECSGPCESPGKAPHTLGVTLDDGATDDGSVFATRRRKELKPLPRVQGAPIQHHSLLVETCENGPVGSGRPVCSGCCKGCLTPGGTCDGSRGVVGCCTSGRVHRYREMVVYHGEQVYP